MKKPAKSEKETAEILQKTFWRDSEKVKGHHAIHSHLKSDVVIVGGGIAGLSIAYKLSTAGKSVIVVEDGSIGSGETGNTSAHLVNALDNRYYNLEKLYGKDLTRLAAKSHTEAIDEIEKTIGKENVDCDFQCVPGYLFADPTDHKDSLQKEFEAASRAGLMVKMLDHVPALKGVRSRCIEFSNQAQFHPLKYLNLLGDSIIKKGGKIFTNTHAAKINEKGITTKDGFRVKADFIVVATNAPINSKTILPLKQFAFRTYVIGATVKKGLLPFALWWDTGNHEADNSIPPYHYVRLHRFNNEFDLLICGGEDHATGLAEVQHLPEHQRYNVLEKWVRKRFPVEEVIYQWSGQVMEPVDSLAYIGRTPKGPENIFVVTGDSGNGLTHATIAGKLIPDLILGNKNEYEKLYDPSRIKLKAAKTFIKEFGGGWFAYLKHKPHDAARIKLSDIKQGNGKIMKVNGEQYAVYRDDENHLHAVSAVCTHLGCIVKWNKDQKSWDCPCHGSRFTYEGKVINGPANEDLPSYKTEKVIR